jgi:hypothetical protein
MSVSEIFKAFCDDLRVPAYKRSEIANRHSMICRRLNKDFYGVDADSRGRYLGSFGRNTANGWVSDIDMVFELPWTTYTQYDNYIGNGQSALLQAVKSSISRTYASTYVKGDGQIVTVSFSDGDHFEVLPAFRFSDGRYYFGDSHSGGSWKSCNPVAEIDAVRVSDYLYNSNLRRLCRMTRAWKYYCDVPIKGLLIDTLADRFLNGWEYADKSYVYYDYMVRDFFEYLKQQPSSQTCWYAIGSGESIYNPDNFRYKATVAYNKAVDATRLGVNENFWSSKRKWREIYGNRFPS